MSSIIEKIRTFFYALFNSPKFEEDHTKLLGVGFDRNAAKVDPVKVARLLQSAGLNATSIGFWGHDRIDEWQDFAKAEKYLKKWVGAMRDRGITTHINVTGTGGPGGGMGRPEFSIDWFNKVLDVMARIGTKGVIFSPMVEADIKEGANAQTREKFLEWFRMTERRWPGKRAWNFQAQPAPNQVPPGWIGVSHPQRWNASHTGFLAITDAPINPRINEGQYPNEKATSALTDCARGFRQRGIGFIYWGQHEDSTIEEDAIKYVSGARK